MKYRSGSDHADKTKANLKTADAIRMSKRYLFCLGIIVEQRTNEIDIRQGFAASGIHLDIYYRICHHKSLIERISSQQCRMR